MKRWNFVCWCSALLCVGFALHAAAVLRADEAQVRVFPAIRRVAVPAPIENATEIPADVPRPGLTVDDDSSTEESGVIQLARWHGGWHGGWGSGWGYRGYVWGGYGFGRPSFYRPYVNRHYFYRPYFYRPYFYGGGAYSNWGYGYGGGYGYGCGCSAPVVGFGGLYGGVYNNYGYGGYGGYGYPAYAGAMFPRYGAGFGVGVW